MSKPRDLRRKLQEIEARTPAARTTVERHFAQTGKGETALLSEIRKRVASHRSRGGRPAAPVALGDACPGTEIRDSSGSAAYLIAPSSDAMLKSLETLHALFLRDLRRPDSPARNRLSRATGSSEPKAGQLLFMDIETTGLGSTPLFLIGVMTVEKGGFSIRQYLARDYSEEAAVIRCYAAEVDRRKILVSFNGKSFDVPYIRTRAAYHRLECPATVAHFDLLHEARRVWKGQLPNCRLQTLESEICGRSRHDDIDGADIPDAYHDFVRSGDASDIVLIAKHNVLDLLTMADIMVRFPEE